MPKVIVQVNLDRGQILEVCQPSTISFTPKAPVRSKLKRCFA
jgi:hypothetical protein